MTNAPPSDPDTRANLRACCEALDDRKAEDIAILYLGPKSSVADFFVVATGTSEPHLRALAGAVRAALKEREVGTRPPDGGMQSGWTVLDVDSFIVHLFRKDMRDRYRLEDLWKDAERLPLAALVG